MKKYLLIQNKNLLNSLKRYLAYILKWESQAFCYPKNKNAIYFIDENTEITNKLLSFFKDIPSKNVILLGTRCTKSNKYINLLASDALHNNFKKAVTSSSNMPSPFLFHSEIKEKLIVFFKGHGEKSLLKLLNETNYCLYNGPDLVNSNNVTCDEYKEYQEVYFKPGFMYWEKFTSRFDKYKIYLQVADFKDEVKSVEKLKDEANRFIERLKSFTLEELKQLDYDKLNEFRDCLNKIDSIFMKIREIVINVPS